MSFLSLAFSVGVSIVQLSEEPPNYASVLLKPDQSGRDETARQKPQSNQLCLLHTFLLWAKGREKKPNPSSLIQYQYLLDNIPPVVEA